MVVTTKVTVSPPTTTTSYRMHNFIIVNKNASDIGYNLVVTYSIIVPSSIPPPLQYFIGDQELDLVVVLSYMS